MRWSARQVVVYVVVYAVLLALGGLVLQVLSTILMPDRPVLWWSMLLKPLVAIAALGAVFGATWALMAMLRRTLPEGRIKRRLFQPWNRRSP